MEEVTDELKKTKDELVYYMEELKKAQDHLEYVWNELKMEKRVSMEMKSENKILRDFLHRTFIKEDGTNEVALKKPKKNKKKNYARLY